MRLHLRGRRVRATRRKLSGALADRIDILVARRPADAPRRSAGDAGEGSAAVRERVARRARASSERLGGGRCNAEMTPAEARAHCRLERGGRGGARRRPTTALRLSGRGHDRVLRVARTIADLDGEPSGSARRHVGAGARLRRRERWRERLGACDECLRRAWLVGGLVGLRSSAIAAGSPARARRSCSALDDEDLAAAVGAEGRRAARWRGHARAARGGCAAALDGGRLLGVLPPRRRLPGRRCASSPTRRRSLFGRGDPALLAALAPSRPSPSSAPGAPAPTGARWPTRPRPRARRGRAGRGQRDGARDRRLRATAGALDAAGLTVAVLGGGPDVAYPAAHARALHERIVRARAWSSASCRPGRRRAAGPSRPATGSWPRSRGMTVVVEAPRALRLADHRGARRRPRPRRRRRAGPRSTLARPRPDRTRCSRDGARVVRDGQDVLDALLGAGARARVRSAPGPALEPRRARVLDARRRRAADRDAVAARPRPQRRRGGRRALARLELLGYLAWTRLGALRADALTPRSAGGAVPARRPTI